MFILFYMVILICIMLIDRGYVINLINGYNNRQQTEENEAIGTAYQRAQLLSTDDRSKASQLIQQYLEALIEFFKSGISDENNQWWMTSLEKQSQLWGNSGKRSKSNTKPNCGFCIKCI